MPIPPKIFGPGTQESPLYGIYMPIIGKFLIVYHDLMPIENLRISMSSKVDSELICISDCTNYCHNIIDNSVCLDWSIDLPPDTLNLREYKNKNLTLVNRTNAYDDLNSLHEFALQSLAVMIILKEIEMLDPIDLLQEITIGSYLLLESRSVLEYHQGLAPKFLKDIQDKIDQVKEEKTKTLKNYMHSLYWATTIQDIQDLMCRPPKNQIESLVHARYH